MRAALRKARSRFEKIKKRKKNKKSFQKNRANFELLASGVAHEFNNILGAADGHAEWALETGDPLKMKEALEIVRLACQRSSQITRALQGLFQPREEERKAFDLKGLESEIKSLYQGICEREQIFFCWKADSEKNKIILEGSQSRLLEVFINLIKNSMEALRSSPSNEKKEISIEVIKMGKKLKIYFRDTGPGIPRVYQGDIFEAFFTSKGVMKNASSQSESTRGWDLNNTGLGLYISRQIAEEHGGTLKYIPSKRAGRGALFELLLPLSGNAQSLKVKSRA